MGRKKKGDGKYMYMNPRPGNGDVKDCSVRALCNYMSLHGHAVDYYGALAFLQTRNIRFGTGKRQNISSGGTKTGRMEEALIEIGFREINEEEAAETACIVFQPQHAVFRDWDGTHYDTFNSSGDFSFEYWTLDANKLQDAQEKINKYTPVPGSMADLKKDRRKSLKKTNYVRLTQAYFTECDRSRSASRGKAKIFMDAIVKLSLDHKREHGMLPAISMGVMRSLPGFDPGQKERERMIRGLIRFGFMEYVS